LHLFIIVEFLHFYCIIFLRFEKEAGNSWIRSLFHENDASNNSRKNNNNNNTTTQNSYHYRNDDPECQRMLNTGETTAVVSAARFATEEGEDVEYRSASSSSYQHAQ
jgi:hypothetical protein